jgi:hypothetical protein
MVEPTTNQGHERLGLRSRIQLNFGFPQIVRLASLSSTVSLRLVRVTAQPTLLFPLFRYWAFESGTMPPSVNADHE